MDVTSPETATLGIWTIARFAALAVLATEALFLYTRRREARYASPARVAWTLTPALLLAGLFLWCTVFVASSRRAQVAPAVAQLAR
ncbi:MAG TPA: hypothetical protein VFP52_11340 [Myxococcales bacterium]|nr:hypothetical protein [Myxococcales bacterium]HET9753551.1 hypothetical protein [Myxococcales bacterium]